LNELKTKSSLEAAHARWADREPGLADLAFSIETRIGNLREIVRLTDENMGQLGAELEEADDLDALIAGGYPYRIENELALRRSLIGFNAFIVEARSLFENLARFYQTFLMHYFAEAISETRAYEVIAALRPSAEWANQLRLLRHDIVHARSPWLRFDVTAATPRFDPVLVLDWRREGASPNAEVHITALREFRTSIVSATSLLRDDLIARVIVWP
jgi:hypothetical protein